MSHKLYEYDVTIPVQWSRDDTSKVDFESFAETAPLHLFNGTGIRVTDLEGHIAQESLDEWAENYGMKEGELLEKDVDRWSNDFLYEGTFTVEKTVYAPNQRGALRIVLDVLRFALEDDAVVDWCRGIDWSAAG